ncbi:MAG: hypothetical protein EBZ22_03465, partial [Flavobacteriia bacterium]|nr:hypothetical protein [Flavobacteriia bacterium]
MKKRLFISALSLLAALLATTSCQEEVANLDLLQATPVHAVLMVPVRDAAAVTAAWSDGSPLPYADDVAAMLQLLPVKD